MEFLVLCTCCFCMLPLGLAFIAPVVLAWQKDSQITNLKEGLDKLEKETNSDLHEFIVKGWILPHLPDVYDGFTYKGKSWRRHGSSGSNYATVQNLQAWVKHHGS